VHGVLDAVLHPGGEGRVARLDAGEHSVLTHPGAAGEVVKGPGLEADRPGGALELEGLDHQGLGDGVKDATEGVLGAVGRGVDVAIAAAILGVELDHAHRQLAGAQPLRDQVGVGRGPEDQADGGVEFADHLDERGAVRRGDVRRVGAHCSSLSVSRTASSRRYVSIHAVTASRAAGSRWTGRRWACRVRVTSPACSRTCTCWETACTVIGNGSASSLNRAGPGPNLGGVARRTGSASPPTAWSSRSRSSCVRAMPAVSLPSQYSSDFLINLTLEYADGKPSRSSRQARRSGLYKPVSSRTATMAPGGMPMTSGDQTAGTGSGRPPAA